MKRRGKRLAFTVTVTGLAGLLGLGIRYRDAMRDHIVAWRFQLTRETMTIDPVPALKGVPGTMAFRGVPWARADTGWWGSNLKTPLASA